MHSFRRNPVTCESQLSAPRRIQVLCGARRPSQDSGPAGGPFRPTGHPSIVSNNNDANQGERKVSPENEERKEWTVQQWTDYAGAGFAYDFYAKLENKDLQGANFEGADLMMMKFDYGNLEGANFRGANLEHCSFFGANLKGAIFDGATLSRTNCTQADFRDASLKDADLEEAEFERANLVGTNLDGANLARTNLYLAKVEGQDKDDLRRRVCPHVRYTFGWD